MGNNLEMGFTFPGVQDFQCESILIPGQIVIKECLEELGALREYMTNYHQWTQKAQTLFRILFQAGKEFGTRFALSLIALIFI